MRKNTISCLRGVVEKCGASGEAVAEPLCQPSEFLHMLFTDRLRFAAAWR